MEKLAPPTPRGKRSGAGRGGCRDACQLVLNLIGLNEDHLASALVARAFVDLDNEQGWHAGVDKHRVPTSVRVDEGFSAVSWYVDVWTPAADAFSWKIEPATLLVSPDLASPPTTASKPPTG